MNLTSHILEETIMSCRNSYLVPVKFPLGLYLPVFKMQCICHLHTAVSSRHPSSSKVAPSSHSDHSF